MKMLKHYVAAGAIVFALVCTAHAASEDDSVVQVPVTKAIEMFNALSALDGYEDVIKDGQQEKSVRRPYKFGGGLRLLIAKNISVLKPVLEIYETARRGLVSEATKDGATVKDGAPGAVKFSDDIQKLLASPQVVKGLVHIKASELNLDQNPIPPTVLSGLSSLLDP